MEEQLGGPTKSNWNFQLNPPTLICFLYVAAYFTVITAVIGVVLAYVWRREDNAAWEDSHYTYLIRTFWMGVLGGGAGVVAIVALALFGLDRGSEPQGTFVVGFLGLMVLLFAFLTLLAVRCALSLVNAQRNRPMPRPRTWIA